MATNRQAVITNVYEAFGVTLVDTNRVVCLIADDTVFAERYRLYTDLEGVSADFPDGEDTYNVAEAFFTQTGGNGFFYVAPVREVDTNTDPDVKSLLTDLSNDSTLNFIGVTFDKTIRDSAQVIDGQLASYAYSKPYHIITESFDTNTITSATTDPASVNSAVYNALSGDDARRFGNMTMIYTALEDDYQGAAMLGQLMKQDIGTQTLKFKKPLLSQPLEVTGAQLEFCLGKNCNIYTGTNELTGRAFLKEGTSLKDNNFTDQSLGAIWLEIQLNNNIYDLLESYKVGIDDEGFTLLENAVSPIFVIAQNQGIIQSGQDKFSIEFSKGTLPREIVGTYSYVEGESGHFVTNTITVTKGE